MFYLLKGLNEKLAKKPFSIRVEPNVISRFKALSTVLNIDGANMLSELITNKEQSLTKEEQEAYEALLRLWREDEK